MDFLFAWPWDSALKLACTCAVNALVRTQHFGAARTVHTDRAADEMCIICTPGPVCRTTLSTGQWQGGLYDCEQGRDDVAAVKVSWIAQTACDLSIPSMLVISAYHLRFWSLALKALKLPLKNAWSTILLHSWKLLSLAPHRMSQCTQTSVSRCMWTQ